MNVETKVSLNISTGSLYPTNPVEAVIPIITTDVIAHNALAFKNTIDRITPTELRDHVAVGVSLHWSDRLNATQLVHSLDKHDISITAQDVPEIETLQMLGDKMRETFLSTDSLVQKAKATANDGGWYLMNVGSEKNRIRRLHDGMFATRDQKDAPVVLQMSLEEFLKHKDRSPLFKTIQSYAAIAGRNIAFALEIDARAYTVSQYMEIIRRLNSETYHGIPIYADMDLGNLAQTSQFHPKNEVPNVNEFFKTVMTDGDASLVATVALNQYVEGNQSHVWLGDPKGKVNIPKAGEVIANARDRMPFGPIAIVEMNPLFMSQLHKSPLILRYFLQHFT